MITIEKSIFIDRPLQEVFEFISNPANDARWQSSTRSAEWTAEGLVSKQFGKQFDSALESLKVLLEENQT